MMLVTHIVLLLSTPSHAGQYCTLNATNALACRISQQATALRLRRTKTFRAITARLIGRQQLPLGGSRGATGASCAMTYRYKMSQRQ